jgi:hypothetical protein
MEDLPQPPSPQMVIVIRGVFSSMAISIEGWENGAEGRTVGGELVSLWRGEVSLCGGASADVMYDAQNNPIRSNERSVGFLFEAL